MRPCRSAARPASPTGTLAPAMVSQKTAISIASMSGKPEPAAGDQPVDGPIEIEALAACRRASRRGRRSAPRRCTAPPSATGGSRRRPASASCDASSSTASAAPRHRGDGTGRLGGARRTVAARRSPSSPVRSAAWMRSSPSSSRSATQRALGSPGNAARAPRRRARVPPAAAPGALLDRGAACATAPARHLGDRPAAARASPRRWRAAVGTTRHAQVARQPARRRPRCRGAAPRPSG